VNRRRQPLFALPVGLLLVICGEPTPILSTPVVSTGIIKTCEHGMGEERCGQCYCLETPELSCEVIDYRDIGDLGHAVGKTVQFEGTRDVLCTGMCPCQIKLFRIEIWTLTDDGYRFVEPSPTPSPLPPTEASPTATATPLSTSTPVSTPTPTAPPPGICESTCDSSDFALEPNLPELISLIVEPERIRGAIDAFSGLPGEPWLRTAQGTLYLSGVDFDEATEDGAFLSAAGAVKQACSRQLSGASRSVRVQLVNRCGRRYRIDPAQTSIRFPEKSGIGPGWGRRGAVATAWAVHRRDPRFEAALVPALGTDKRLHHFDTPTKGMTNSRGDVSVRL
jgi:hypothetical protein